MSLAATVEQTHRDAPCEDTPDACAMGGSDDHEVGAERLREVVEAMCCGPTRDELCLCPQVRSGPIETLAVVRGAPVVTLPDRCSRRRRRRERLPRDHAPEHEARVERGGQHARKREGVFRLGAVSVANQNPRDLHRRRVVERNADGIRAGHAPGSGVSRTRGDLHLLCGRLRMCWFPVRHKLASQLMKTNGVRRGRSPASLKAEHTPRAVRRRLNQPPTPSYLHDFIYGAIDGTVTTFAVVSGVAGADLGASVVIILGGANLIADGFSMAVSNYLGSRAERQRRELARRQEDLQIRLVPEGEREEIRQIFAAKGFAGEDLERVVEVITSDPDLWAETMMTEELGYGSSEPNALRAAGSTLIAFLTIGFLPLAAFVYDLIAPGELEQAFTLSAVMTGIAFFVVGSMKSRFVEQSWWRSGAETLAVGSVAAALAYVVGALLKGVA